MSDEAKCDCQHCGGHIEFPSEAAGQTVECPHCKCETLLSDPSPATNQIVNCPCQHCGGAIEFDANELVEENSLVQCPHCGLETRLFSPEPQREPELEIFINIREKQRGPFATPQVVSMWNNGLITSDAVYWHEGMSDWLPVSTFIKKFSAPLPSTTTAATNTSVPVPMVPGVNVSKLMQLAKAAAEAGNYQEAQGYYTKALEYFPQNSVAWIGKGEAVGWLSTIECPKATEMMAAFKNAIDFAGDAEKEAIRQECAHKANTIAIAYYSTAKNYLLNFKEVPGVWPNYVHYCRTIIDALIIAHELNPTNQTIVKNVIHISTDNKNGFKYKFGLGLIKTYNVTPEYKSRLTAIIDTFSTKMRVLNPDYEPAQVG